MGAGFGASVESLLAELAANEGALSGKHDDRRGADCQRSHPQSGPLDQSETEADEFGQSAVRNQRRNCRKSCGKSETFFFHLFNRFTTPRTEQR